jgi:hypothetical protein
VLSSESAVHGRVLPWKVSEASSCDQGLADTASDIADAAGSCRRRDAEYLAGVACMRLGEHNEIRALRG